MDLLPPSLRAPLRANAQARVAAVHAGRAEPDPAPVVKFFNPLGAATWLATKLDSDGQTLFGLADLGFGCPELGSFSLREIAAVRLPFGLGIERDLTFDSAFALSVWSEIARCEGSISAAEMRLTRARSAPDPDPDLHQLPPDTGG